MSKKDKIAIAASIIYLVLYLLFVFDPAVHSGGMLSLMIFPLVIYWGHRLIKNDISFINRKNK